MNRKIKITAISTICIILFCNLIEIKVIGQTPPNNLSFDQENHLMKLEGLNTSSFYNEETLEAVYLQFEQSDYWQQLHDAYDTDIYVRGTLTYKGEVYSDIGAQFKGNTSYRKVTNDAKYSFAIALDEYVDGQDIEGYNTLNFNNAFEDPSFMKEVVYNHLNRKNIPGAKSNFIKLYINGEYWGIYSNVQQLNKDFTKEWFMTNNGSLWRADAANTTPVPAPPGGGGGGGGGGGAQWGDGTTALNYLGTDTSSYQQYYTLKHSSQDKPWELLVKLTDILNNTPDEQLQDSVSNYLDIDKTLWFLAHETVFSDDDSYIMKGKQDYYIYFEPETQRFTPLEFDGNSAMDNKNINWGMFYNEEKDNYPLMNRLYAIPALRQRYLAHARTIIDELLAPDDINALIDKYDALIKTWVEGDEKNLYTYNDYINSVAQLRSFMADRKTILLADPEVNQVGLSITSVEQKVQGELFASPSENVPVQITTSVSGSSGVSKVYLYYSNYYVGKFSKTEMYDDGLHSDGTSGDGVFGAEIPGFSNTDFVRYYIEAIADDNAKTATYSPVGAEHDVYYYRVGLPEEVSSELVLNEICASNKTIIADNQGEYDDWIEIYNNSSEPISLLGYYLTDNLSELQKWPLPEFSIGAKAYYTVWADNDEAQGADHANFKLSADGEELFLIDPEGKIADQLLFGGLGEDMAWGRVPNGTGTFGQTQPSFGSENSKYIGPSTNGAFTIPEIPVQMYPNPASDFITIESGVNEQVNFYLYNLQGSLVSKDKVYISAQIDLSELPNGLYTARFESNKGVVVKILIVR